MGILPVFYVGIFFVFACAAYICCTSLLTKFRGAAKEVFVAILAFGASAYLGFFVIVLLIGNSPLKGIFSGQLEPISFALAYVIPGVAGAWVGIKAIRSFK